MQVFVLFLLLCFLIGGTDAARPIRDRPIIMIGFCTVVAASFYSLRVVL